MAKEPFVVWPSHALAMTDSNDMEERGQNAFLLFCFSLALAKVSISVFGYPVPFFFLTLVCLVRAFDLDLGFPSEKVQCFCKHRESLALVWKGGYPLFIFSPKEKRPRLERKWIS